MRHQTHYWHKDSVFISSLRFKASTVEPTTEWLGYCLPGLSVSDVCVWRSQRTETSKVCWVIWHLISSSHASMATCSLIQYLVVRMLAISLDWCMYLRASMITSSHHHPAVLASCMPSASCDLHCQAHPLRLSRITLPCSLLNSRASHRFYKLSRTPRTREVDAGQPDSGPVVHNNAIAEQRFERKSAFIWEPLVCYELYCIMSMMQCSA